MKTGQVRFGYMHFAFLGDESFQAAEASECADDQGAFWPYHDKLFDSQSGENQGAFSKDNLKRFAVELKLDTKAFNDCLDSGKYKDLVEQEVAFGQQLGVQSTPSFIINGRLVVGGESYEAFQQIFDAALLK